MGQEGIKGTGLTFPPETTKINWQIYKTMFFKILCIRPERTLVL